MSHLARFCQEGKRPAGLSLLLPTVRGGVTKRLQNVGVGQTEPTISLKAVGNPLVTVASSKDSWDFAC